MPVDREKQKIDRIKEETVSLKTDFRKKSSLIVKISIFYLLLTIVNLLVFWVATGANQIRLIRDKAELATHSTAYELIRRMQPILKNAAKVKELSAGRKKNVEAFLDLLKFTDTDKLIIPSFRLITSSGEAVLDYPDGKLTQPSKQVRQRVLKALQHREFKNQPFYGEPDIFTYNIEIYIPLSVTGVNDLVFFSHIPMESIRKELDSLVYLALAMVGIMIVVQTVFAFILFRMMIMPIRQLAVGAEAVGSGNLDVEVENRKTDELGLLIHLFNRMVASLKEKTMKLETTIEELEKHHEMMQNELKMASSIQAGIMPGNNISDRVNVSVYYAPLEKVSGDYYDIFPLPDGSLGLLITDASGHGVPAALVTIMAKIHFSSLAEKITSPGELFARVNTQLSRSIATSDYLTAFYLVIKPDLSVEYCNASHQKAIIFPAGGGEIMELDTGGFFIGVMEESPIDYETKSLKLKAGDRIILYTDGIVEGTNHAKEEFGMDKFISLITENSSLSVEELNKLIISEVDKWADGEERKDDYTLFIIEVSEQSVQARDLMAEALSAYRANDFAAARDIYREALKEEPGNITARLNLANSLFFLKDYSVAAPLFEEYNRASGSNAFARLKLGVCYAKMNRESEAIEQYEKAIALNRDLAEAHGQLAISYANQGEKEKALEHISRALQLKPDDQRLPKLREKISRK